MKKILTGIAASLALSFGAVAADFGPQPANYEALAEAYIHDRLEDPRSARIEIVGEPYQVLADIAGYQGLNCWAIDVRVKARLPSGSFGGYVPYTVLFLDGEAVALEDDARRLARL